MRLSRWFSIARRKSAVFILGCQRSGTSMLLGVLGKAPEVFTYSESNKKAMAPEYNRLRDEKRIRRIVSWNRNKFVVFKPLNDSQHADLLLAYYPTTKIIWMYRRYPDAINSLIKKWGPHQRNIINWIIAHGDGQGLPEATTAGSYPIYAERMTPETLSVLQDLAQRGIGDEEGAALVWYARNQIYFDRALEYRSNALLVQYEDLVLNLDERARRIFDFIGCPYRESYVETIFTSSVGKDAEPRLRSEVRDLCDGMMKKLNRAYAKTKD